MRPLMRASLRFCVPVIVCAAALPAAAPASSSCSGFTVHGGGYPAQRVGSVIHHYATCGEVRAIVGRWAKRGYHNTGPGVYGLWTCSFEDFLHGRPGRRPGQTRNASCTAGLNGYVHFRLTAE